MRLNQFHQVIVATLLAHSEKAGVPAERLKWYRARSAPSAHRRVGLTASQYYAAEKELKPVLRQMTDRQKLALARRLFRTHLGELQGMGTTLLAMSLDALTPDRFDYLDEIASDLGDWGVTDAFSLYVLQPLLFRHERETVARLRGWNCDKHMWKRRCSVVAFCRKAGAGGHFAEVVIELCDNLKHDDEALVRKAVGWALKDNLRGAKHRLLPYVKSLRREGVSSVITLYAIRDLSARERDEVLRIRPSGR